MKKILISFLSFIMFFAIGVSITQLVKTNENYVMAETASVEHEEFVMETGAAFRPYWTTPSCGITYNAKISNSLIGKGYQPKLFVVPYDYITNMLNSSDNAVKTLATSGDYKGAAEAQGYSFIDLVPYVVSGIDGYSWLVGGVKNINNNQMNRKFFGVFYYEKGTSRVYADILYDNPINNARSMAYVTSSAYYEMEDTINAGTAASYAEDMLVHFMDMAIARAVYKAGVTDATPASITYKNKNTIADNDIKSESVSAETKESGRRVRIITFDTTIGLTASYYDDLFTYQMRIGYIKKTANGDGTYSYSPVSVDVTKYLDFKLDIISVNNTVKEYVSIDLSTNYITPLQVGTVTSKEIAVRAGMEPTSNKLGMPVTITSFDLTENSSYVKVETPTQYYEDFNNQPSAYKPMSNVTIKADGNKRLFEKSYTVIPTYSNNAKLDTDSNSGKTATITIGASQLQEGSNVVGSVSSSFKIYNETFRIWTLTIHHKNENGVTLANDTVINFNSSSATAYGKVKGIIYNETLSVGGKTVKNIIADIANGTNNLSKKYLPNLEWVEGMITGDTEITIVYSSYDSWDGTYFADKVTAWQNATTAKAKSDIEASVYDGGDGSKNAPYIINTAEQLAFMAKISYNIDYGYGLHFKLGQSLDLSTYYWTPICFDSDNYLWNFFKGVFDGNGFTIKIKIDGSQGVKYLDNGVEKTLNKAWGYGLFTGVTGQVSNLTMMGTDSVEHRTGIISYLLRQGGKVENINNFATVTATRTVSGDGLIFTGGIVGAGGQSSSNAEGVKFINCNNYGAVTTNFGLTGGIVGESYGINTVILDCNNFGVITGGHRVGGIVGRTTQNIRGCNNFGNVRLSTVKTGYTDYATCFGGIAGVSAGGSSVNCINYGNIICTNGSGAVVGDSVGGICGDASRAYIYNCQNHGIITASTNFGNIYGVVQDANNNPNDEEHILKFEFYNAEGDMVWDYKNVSLVAGTKYDRNTDVGINLKMPITWVEEYFGATWTNISKVNGKNTTYGITWDYIWQTDEDENYVLDASGNKIQIETDKINLTRGTMELLVNAVAYQVSQDQIAKGNIASTQIMLPDRFWAVGFADSMKVEKFVFRPATVWDGKRTYSTQASNYVTQRDTHFAKKVEYQTNATSEVKKAMDNAFSNMNRILKSVFNAEGTQADPYIISTGAQLAFISDICNGGGNSGWADNVHYGVSFLVDKYLKLANGIDLNGNAWTPIGYNLKNKESGSTLYTWFGGVFDGNGYTISGLNFNVSTSSCAGLFGSVNGTIKNLNVQGSVKAAHRAGGLTYFLNSGGTGKLIQNVKTFVDVTTTENAGLTGGIVGAMEHGGKILDSQNYGNVTASTGSVKVGGILGSMAHNDATLSNVTNYGNVSGKDYLGGVLGYTHYEDSTNYSYKIINAVNYGNVTSVGYRVGGVVGLLRSTGHCYNITNYGNISSTTTSSSELGGAIGITHGAKVYYAKNYGVITAQATVGGVVGNVTNSSTLYHCENHGAVNGSDATTGTGQWIEIGAIAGYVGKGSMYYECTNSATVKVNGSVDNRIVGRDNGASTGNDPQTYHLLIINYYYEDGSIAAESKRLDYTFDSHRFAYSKKDDTISPTISGYLPNLFWVEMLLTQDTVVDVIYSKADTWDGTSAKGFAGGNGTKENPYLIETAEQLKYMSDLYYGVTENYGGGLYYKLTSSIDLSGYDWTPIGLRGNSSSWRYFEGSFDGNGKTIKGLRYNNGTHVAAGLFSCVSGTVNDLTIQGDITVDTRAGALCYYLGVDDGSKTASISNIKSFTNITATNTAENYIGGIVGTTRYANITNCVNYGEIVGADHIGGICGYAALNVVINSCVNNGVVRRETTSEGGYHPVAGIVGRGNSITINNSFNTGVVSSNADNVGGICGITQSNTIVDNCDNYATISGIDFVGGISGEFKSGSSGKNCDNKGVVSGQTHIGGIVGRSYGNVESCNNHNNVTGTNYIGGVAGYLLDGGIITSSNNSGTISGTNDVGGIAGFVGGTLNGDGTWGSGDVFPQVKDSINTGVVKGADKVGGIVGRISSSKMYNCTNKASVTASVDSVGGVAGEAVNASYLESCRNEGNVEDTTNTSGSNNGSIVGYLGGAVSNEGDKKSELKNCSSKAGVTVKGTGTGVVISNVKVIGVANGTHSGTSVN